MSARRLLATRRLAHLLLERAARGRPPDRQPDRETAARLLDPRLAPGAETRRRVIAEALALARAAAAALGGDERLAGELRTNLRIALRDREGKPFSVLAPSVVRRADGTAAVLVMVPDGDRGAEARARRYRFAVGRLTKRRADAFLVHPDGTVGEAPVSRSGPRGAAYPDRGCSPSGRPRSGRRPR